MQFIVYASGTSGGVSAVIILLSFVKAVFGITAVFLVIFGLIQLSQFFMDNDSVGVLRKAWMKIAAGITAFGIKTQLLDKAIDTLIDALRTNGHGW